VGQPDFDCTDNVQCGIIGKNGAVDWTLCTHPRAPKQM
jgi:hypothetical protein